MSEITEISAESAKETTAVIFEPGSVIVNRYEVIDFVGSGGMGSVVKVVDRVLDNDVLALKLLYPHLVKDNVIFARFRNEVLLTRKLAHPNIVRLYDFGEAGRGYYFLSMEYVEGVSLGDRIYDRRRGKVTVEEAARYLFEIAQAMQHAHQMNVIHRDLKPDNVLLTRNGSVKLTDFGLARSLIVDKGFTQSGEAVGTPYYMAPEQIRGDKADERCDIYALGIIAYELVTRRRPFSDDAWFALAAQHLKEEMPALATKESSIPRWYDEFAHICSEKHPDNRYQTMEEVTEVLVSQMSPEQRSDLQLPALYLAGAPKRGRVRRRRRAGESSPLVRHFVAACIVATILALSLFVVRSIPGVNQVIAGLMLQYEASSGSDLGSAKQLIGANVVLSNEDFFKSISEGDLQNVAAIIQGGMSVDAVNDDGTPALVFAAVNDRYEITSKLLDSGANVEAGDVDGTTVIHVASKRKDVRLLKLLLAKGAYVNARDGEGRTPLILASKIGSIEVAQLLLESGAWVNVSDNAGAPPLVYAIASKSVPLVELLLERGAEVDARDKSGATPLFYVAEMGNIPLIRTLLDAGADPRITDYDGKSALASLESEERQKLLEYAAAVQGDDSLRVAPAPRTRPDPREAATLRPEPESRSVTGRKTTLRTRGEPVGRFVTSSGGTVLTNVEVSIRNITDVAAEGVSVQVVAPNGDLINMTGPSEIDPYDHQKYTAEVSVPVTSTRRMYAKPTCSNCRN